MRIDPEAVARRIAEVAASGAAVITKVPGSGGAVTVRTCREQLLYEIHDPADYITPDVVVDFTSARLDEVGPDRVRISGGSGRPRPAQLKVSVGISTIQPSWVFVPSSPAFNPGLAAMNRNAVVYKDELNLGSVLGEVSASFTGILVGDVNNSWVIPAV